MTKAKLSAAAGLLTLVALFAAPLAAESTTWTRVKGTRLTVLLPRNANIDRLYRNLRTRRIKAPRSLPRDASRAEKLTALVKQMDAIFKEVITLQAKKIKLTGRERVVILENRKQLVEVYKKLGGRDPRKLCSFYSGLRKTVFTCPEEMGARCLAHELTHTVNDLAHGGKMPALENEKEAYRMEVNF
jgi:hypothetical protein